MRAAVKVVDRAKLTPEDDAALKDEVAILRVLRHDHIVRIFDFYQVTWVGFYQVTWVGLDWIGPFDL